MFSGVGISVKCTTLVNYARLYCRLNMNWNPENFLNIEKIKNSGNFAIIVLNRPIKADKDLVECLWNQGRTVGGIQQISLHLIFFFSFNKNNS